MAHYYDTMVSIGSKSYRVAVPVDADAKTFGELMNAVTNANRNWADLCLPTRATIIDNGFLRRRPVGCMSYESFRSAVL